MNQVFKIFVVEDEKLIRENLINKIIACNQGYELCGFAVNGKDAFEQIQALNPDVVVTDIKMPIMNGVELASNLKTIKPDLPVLFVSGFADFEFAQKALRMNIEDYLLKPVKMDRLKKTLSDIREKLIDSRKKTLHKQVRQLISSMEEKDVTTYFSNDDCLVMLINIGNLGRRFTSGALQQYYNEIWHQLDIQNTLPNGFTDCFLFDGNASNSKLMVVSYKNFDDDFQAVNYIYDFIKKMTVTINVSIFYSKLEEATNLGKTVENLRILVNQQMVIDKDIISDINDTQPLFPPAIIDNIMRIKMIELINNEQFGMLIKEVHSNIVSAINKDMPQIWIEDYLHQFFRLFQQYSKTMSEAELYHIEYTFFDNMCHPLFSQDLSKHLAESINNIFQSSSEEITQDSSVIDKIKSYIHENFNENISLSDITEEFNYTSSHIIKLFKRHTGETPMKYKINIRVTMAKNLLINNPEMDIKEISESVGYYDQHYFSRIFKSIIGDAPSDYRKKNL